MAKRDYIKEIREIQSRVPKGEKGLDTPFTRMQGLLDLFNRQLSGKTEGEPLWAELSEYLVVRVVALLQQTFKDSIRDMVDCHERNAEDIPEVQETITLAMVREFKNQSLTIGEFVSHLKTLSSYTAIASAFDSVCFEKLADVVEKDAHHNLTKEIGASVDSLFKRRNIICHELSTLEPISRNELLHWLVNAANFISTIRDFTRNYVKAHDLKTGQWQKKPDAKAKKTDLLP